MMKLSNARVNWRLSLNVVLDVQSIDCVRQIFSSKINVLQKREYTYAKNFIRHLLTNKIFSSGIAPDLITELAKSYRIIEGNEINQLSTKYIWLKNEVNELIANDKIFER